MNVKELRIGNWFIENGKPNKFRISYFDQWDGIKEHAKPIPLTEEWLLKLGFENKGERCYNIWTLNESDALTFTEELYCYVGSSHQESPPYYVDIKHVHQLQNLYFALTGEELTIE